MSHDPEHPWLPKDPDESFDPLAHAGITIDAETPIVVTPRGGAREVGRSCYQLDTGVGTYLVDCGLNQGDGGQFPDFRGLDRGKIDAVFLTHAHIDHSGGLPVLEAHGLLDDDAPVVMTRPTAVLAETLLDDSLKIHRREAQRPGREQSFTAADVDAIYDRFETIDYQSNQPVAEFADGNENEDLTFTLGNAGHLLGSSWISFQRSGLRVVFSGDLGGRVKHLPPMDPPPRGDVLICESTYGAKHSHKSLSDAETGFFSAIERAIKSHEPVLITTFAVGRAQSILRMLANRLHQLPGNLAQKVTLVLDGMAQETTDQYHTFVRNKTYFDESVVNYTYESGDEQPFLPQGVKCPDCDNERADLLNAFDPDTGENIPVVIAPSGMLTGGHSPRYLVEYIARYDNARVLLTGYQAQGSLGRLLQNALKTDKPAVSAETDAEPFRTEWPDSYTVTWITDEETNERVTRFACPTEWVETIDGLSAHASQHGLLDYARDVGPDTVALVHGPAYAQEHLGQHFVENIEGIEQVTRGRLLTPIPVEHDTELDTATLVPEKHENQAKTVRDELDTVRESVRSIGNEVAAAKHEGGLSETEIREIVRDEIGKSLPDELIEDVTEDA